MRKKLARLRAESYGCKVPVGSPRGKGTQGSLGKVSHSDDHSVVNVKTKSRYTDIKNRRELCSRFKMMFYVTALKFKTILFLCPSAADSTKQLVTVGSGIFS